MDGQIIRCKHFKMKIDIKKFHCIRIWLNPFQKKCPINNWDNLIFRIYHPILKILLDRKLKNEVFLKFDFNSKSCDFFETFVENVPVCEL